VAFESEVGSAASLVSAILEHAGYVTQGEILNDFKDFFRDAGALVYFIGLVGGVVSVLVFGSFRAAQYLIIGPAFYWLLVGPQVDVPGVQHKMGGGEVRNEAIQQETGDRTDYKTKGNVSVSYAFWMFAKPISDTVNLLVDAILPDEDGEDMLFLSKVEGLELIARSKPESSQFIEILENEIMGACSSSFTMAFGASENYIKERATDGLTPKNLVDKPKHRERFQVKKAAFEEEAEKTRMAITPRGTPQTYELLQNSPQEGSKAAELGGRGVMVVNITCAEAWDLLFDELWRHAGKAEPNKLIKASGSNLDEDRLSLQCKEITRKLYDDNYEGDECKLQPGIAMAMLWNHLSHDDFVGRIQRRHRSGSEILNPRQHKVNVAVVSPHRDSNSFIPDISQMKIGVNDLNRPVGYGTVLAPEYQEQAPMFTYSLNHGVTHVEEVGLPIYVMVRARQFLYSFALNLPYYQGLLLYLIAIAYPFFALVVLLPGRATNMLYIPLAWLWIKSWDVGFAAVFILERIMYNILPNWSLSPNLREGPWTYDQFPEILGEGYNFSHIQAVSMHYVFLSMAMSSVPAVMGLMTIKGKKAALASFTDSVQSSATSSSEMAAAEYSIVASNERSQVLAHLRGQAFDAVRNRSGGVEGGSGARSAAAFGAITAFSKMPAVAMNVGRENSLGNALKKSAGALPEVTNKALSTYQNIASQEALYEASHLAVWHPVIGRWGELQMFSDAYAAALDGAGARLSGGYETNDPRSNSIDAYRALDDAKHNVLLDAIQGIGETQGSAMAGLGKELLTPLVNANKKGLRLDPASGFLTSTALMDMLTKNSEYDHEELKKLENDTTLSQPVLRAFIAELNKESGYSLDSDIMRITGRTSQLLANPELTESVNLLRQGGNTADSLIGMMYFGGTAAGGYEDGSPYLESFGGNRTPGRVMENGEFVPHDSEQPGLLRRFHEGGISSLQQSVSSNPLVIALGLDPETLWTQLAIQREREEQAANPQLYQQSIEEAKSRVFEIIMERAGESESASSGKEGVTFEIPYLHQLAIQLRDREQQQYASLSDIPLGMNVLLQAAPKQAVEGLETWLKMTEEQKFLEQKYREGFIGVQPDDVFTQQSEFMPRLDTPLRLKRK
jgi:hypothetical protein